jgi:chorismate mutase
MEEPDLDALRARMDVLNRELVDLLQRRARHAAVIADWKRAHGVPPADPIREADMLARALEGAAPGFDRPVLEHLLREVFAASRDLVVRRTTSSA